MPKKGSQMNIFENSLNHHRDKNDLLSDDEDMIPIPIQLFLWRQSSPFIKQKFGNLTDASAIIFHRVLVQNMLHGLSPCLTDAISSIPRWLLIKAAFPHVMHACSTMIEHNRHSISQQSNYKLSSIEIQLFHTLHYLILHSNENHDQLLSLNSIQLFIYLFIPYIQTYFHNNEKEFLTNHELNQGMRLIWQPLFQYQQPNIRIFKTFVKQEQNSSIDNNNQYRHLPILIQSPIQRSLSVNQPLTNLKSNLDSRPTVYHSVHDLSTNQTIIRAPIVHMNSICSISDLNRLTMPSQSPVKSKTDSCLSSSISTPSIHLTVPSSPQSVRIRSVRTSPLSKRYPSEYLLLATYFDIGIIRTLFSPSWLTDGYLWCLEYLQKRLIDISDEILSDSLKTGIIPINIVRLKSLSNPNINFLNEKNYYKYLKKNYFNQQLTNDIIEQQCIMTTTPTTLLNVSMKYSSRKNSYHNFYKKIKKEKHLWTKSQIHYIDEDGIEHLDLANTEHQISPSKNSRLQLTDPTVLLLKASLSNNSDTTHQSIDIGNNTRQTSGITPITNLNAMKNYSVSDSEINYKYLEEIEEAKGSSGYINRSGTINFSVVLAGLHAVICKEHHLKACELVMNILDILFGLDVISSTEDDIYKKQISNERTSNATTIHDRDNEQIEEWFKQIDIKENEKFQLVIDIILRILKRLGCPNCQPRSRNFLSDQLRGKVRLLLNKLHLLNGNRFEKCFLNFAKNGDLIHILDILHALCGYCSESNNSLAQYTPYISMKSDTHPRQTYSNNFGNTSKNIDGFILNIIFKPFITRLYTMEDYLLMTGNIVLYSECRAFLVYMKENHGGIFRLTVFSSLMDPEKELKIIKQKTRISSNHQLSNENILQSVISEEDEEQQQQHSINNNLYVDLTLVQMGLLRLNFLLKSCPPGTLPDPQFLNTLLFLDAPIISKAAFLLECAYFVRRCSLGQWPEWMRMNITSFRPQDSSLGRVNGTKLNKIYQAAAARMFYIWGEALSSQLEIILDTEEENSSINLWNNDEIFDDYYNEAIINRSGHDCPYSLKLIVCLLLYEITSFLRETYETLPKLTSPPTNAVHFRKHQRTNQPQTLIDSSSDKRLSDRLRMDSVVSQISNRSTISLSSEQPTGMNISVPAQLLSATIINMNERHISFAVGKENDSNESNHTIIIMNDNENAVDGNLPVSTKEANVTGKSKLIRRGSAKLRKPSFRMKEAGKNSHRLSFRNRRRSHISNVSTDTDGHQNNTGNSSMEPTDENPIKTENDFDQENFDNIIHNQVYPWIKIIIRIFNNVNLTCDHRTKCLKNCYDKQTKSCKNLLKALVNMYQLTSFNYKTPNKNLRFSTFLFGEQINDLHIEKENNVHFNDLSTYLEKQVGSLMQIPLMILCKSSVLLEDEHYLQILRLSWELLLDRNEELSACAATIVTLTAARASHLVDKLIHTEMENSSPLIRYNSILRFEILWRFRYQFWIRLEDGAQSMMKIFPPSIEFVLPSPVLGIANLQTVDPPWMPHVKTLVQQVALNQEEVRAVVTTSKTRKKHQQEFIHSALMSEEISKRVARENFAMSTVSMLQAASFEPLLHQTRDDEEEGHTDDDRTVETSVQLRRAHGTFPPAFGAAIFLLVEMLEDEEILENGRIISGAARKALWTCLLNEPTLLIRFFFEKLSHKERRIKSIQSLCKLMLYSTDIPPQFAHAIFNYVLGLLLSMVRSPLDGSQELILAGLTLLWQIIPYVHGLVLKDFKQILRKEQAEMMILITGNIPSTKKLIIHGPDLSQIPTQAIISEDTQFINVLQEALEFFGIPDSKRDKYYLVDIKTQQIQISDTYVRDFYFFRRNIYPQLSLVYMDTKQSQRQLEQVAIYLKTLELSKVLFARYLLENTPFNQIHNSITFFHDELIKSPLFPRKPLESDFNLYTKISDKELLYLDMLHKYNWIKLIACIFFNMDGKTTSTWDITLFLPIINGAFILHCEDLVMLRYCLATYINIVKHFRHIFATDGYLLIMPTILRVYSNIQSNPMLKIMIEYCCRQFFILHRIPFILQMLGSISQLLDTDENSDIADTNKIQPIALFRLLISLEQTNIDAINDNYSILELVKNDSVTTNIAVASLGQGAPLALATIKSLDFCYADEDAIFTLLNCLDVCVTVVAYAPDSIRSLQMLGIIDILLPKYFDYIKDRTNKNDIQKFGRDEIKIIEKLSTTIKTILHVSESLTRTFVEPKSDASVGVGSRHPRGSYRIPSIIPDEDSTSRFIDDRTKSRAQDADERKQASEFRWPRDTLLSIISNFIYFSTQRLKELIKLLNDPTVRLSELLDAKSHARLADIAHTLLKLGSFDPVTISCRGIQNYFQKLLPYVDWSQEQLRPALNLLLRRIDRMFLKICKKPMIKRCFDWEATAGILNGIFLTIDRHPYIAYFPNLKTLLSGCISLILNENVIETTHSVPRLDTPTFPKEFSRAIIKLVGRYLLTIKDQPNLEALTSHNWSTTNSSSATNHLIHFLLPLMFWAGGGRKDPPKLHSLDISYIVTILLSSIKLPSKLASTMGGQTTTTSTAKQFLTVGETLNVSHRSMKQLKDLLQIASLLGLKILIIGFSKYIKREWSRIIQAIKSMCNKQTNISSNLLSFIDFIVSYKTPIYLIFRPFLLHYMHSVTSENERDYDMIISIQQKIIFEKVLPSKSKGEILNELMQELNQLKSELTDEPKTSSSQETRPPGTERVRFDMESVERIKDRNGISVRKNPSNNDRLNNRRTTNTYRFRRQQQLSDSSLNLSPKQRTEKIRLTNALDILERYNNRCRIRCGGEINIKPTRHPPPPLLRSITVPDDRSPSTDEAPLNFSTISNETAPQLRTFRGWKRHTEHLDKTRLSKIFRTSHISSEPSISTDTQIKTLHRSVRQVDEQYSDFMD